MLASRMLVVTKLDGTFRAFNTIELQQAEGRIANMCLKTMPTALAVKVLALDLVA